MMRAAPRGRPPADARLAASPWITAAVAAGGTLAFPAIAQAKPFNGVKLRGAAYQHGFFNILRKYIPLPDAVKQQGVTEGQFYSNPSRYAYSASATNPPYDPAALTA